MQIIRRMTQIAVCFVQVQGCVLFVGVWVRVCLMSVIENDDLTATGQKKNSA